MPRGRERAREIGSLTLAVLTHALNSNNTHTHTFTIAIVTHAVYGERGRGKARKRGWRGSHRQRAPLLRHYREEKAHYVMLKMLCDWLLWQIIY